MPWSASTRTSNHLYSGQAKHTGSNQGACCRMKDMVESLHENLTEANFGLHTYHMWSTRRNLRVTHHTPWTPWADTYPSRTLSIMKGTEALLRDFHFPFEVYMANRIPGSQLPPGQRQNANEYETCQKPKPPTTLHPFPKQADLVPLPQA